MSEQGDQTIWQWIAITATGILGSIAMWGGDRHAKRLDDQDRHMESIDQRHEAHKLWVSENYVKYTTMRERILEALHPVIQSQDRIERKIDEVLNRERENYSKGRHE